MQRLLATAAAADMLAWRFEKPAPDARGGSSRDSRVAHQSKDRRGRAIDELFLMTTEHPPTVNEHRPGGSAPQTLGTGRRLGRGPLPPSCGHERKSQDSRGQRHHRPGLGHRDRQQHHLAVDVS